jgi:cytochrome P450
LHTIPPNTAVFINNAAVQMDRDIWSSDTLVWRPGRWVQTQSNNPIDTTQIKPESADTPIVPVERAYIPWAAGPRVCPGKKFSQVEFVAAIAVLFHQYRVTPIVDVHKGETEASARERTMQVLADSDMALAMRMNHPERLRLRWDKISVNQPITSA